MRLAILFAFAMSLCLWVSDNSNAQGLKEGAEQQSDKQLIERADIITNLHESLFSRVRASGVLSVHIGYRQPLFLSVKELVNVLMPEIGTGDEQTRNALSAFLDDLYLGSRAGLFFLDPEALARVKRRPDENTDADSAVRAQWTPRSMAIPNTPTMRVLNSLSDGAWHLALGENLSFAPSTNTETIRPLETLEYLKELAVYKVKRDFHRNSNADKK